MATLENWIAEYHQASDSTEIPNEWTQYAGTQQLLQFLQFIREHPPRTAAQQRLVQVALLQLIRRVADSQLAAEHEVVDALVDVYHHTADWPGRYLLLQLMAQMGGEYALNSLATVLAAAPPPETDQVAQLLSPLLQSPNRHQLKLLFPRILDAVGHISTAAAVLDLANFATRHGITPVHPASDRGERLAAMLGDAALRLERLDESATDDPAARESQAQKIDDAVPLIVSLCDTLALIGDVRHIGMLNRALALRHRRIQTEAAAALAKLGDKAGQKRLVQLAAEPVARLRVLAYADELGILDEVDPQYRSEQARAEASLALWLAEPSQLGFPPSTLQMIDQRQLYWPGFDEPIECYLFRFEYQLGSGTYSNIGIAGPLTHAFAASLEDLPPDDIYAAFAGWHAEHAEINERSASDTATDPAVIDHLVEKLEEQEYADITPMTLGSFFGDYVLIARARKHDREGVAVADEDGTDWWPGDLSRRPIGEFEAFCIYKGRRLLAAFN